MQEQSVQCFVLTQDPQQSPPSKLHSALFVSSLHQPSKTSVSLKQPLGIEKYPLKS